MNNHNRIYQVKAKQVRTCVTNLYANSPDEAVANFRNLCKTGDACVEFGDEEIIFTNVNIILDPDEDELVIGYRSEQVEN